MLNFSVAFSLAFFCDNAQNASTWYLTFFVCLILFKNGWEGGWWWWRFGTWKIVPAASVTGKGTPTNYTLYSPLCSKVLHLALYEKTSGKVCSFMRRFCYRLSSFGAQICNRNPPKAVLPLGGYCGGTAPRGSTRGCCWHVKKGRLELFQQIFVAMFCRHVLSNCKGWQENISWQGRVLQYFSTWAKKKLGGHEVDFIA